MYGLYTFNNLIQQLKQYDLDSLPSLRSLLDFLTSLVEHWRFSLYRPMFFVKKDWSPDNPSAIQVFVVSEPFLEKSLVSYRTELSPEAAKSLIADKWKFMFSSIDSPCAECIEILDITPFYDSPSEDFICFKVFDDFWVWWDNFLFPAFDLDSFLCLTKSSPAFFTCADNPTDTKLIVGLGNPASDFAFTRHNMGSMSIDHLVKHLNLGHPQLKFRSTVFHDPERNIIFLKPLTFMNLSGLAILEAVASLNLKPENILVIYDELALPWGRLRLRAKGSAGGHNGLASIIEALSTESIPRLRLGLGGLGDTDSKVDRVLGRLSPAECDQLPQIFEKVETAVSSWLTLDIQKAMSKSNSLS